jgi:hypothetical protein
MTNNYISPNVANMKIMQHYHDDYNNESETENDSHKSNSKRKKKRVLGAVEECLKKTSVYDDF